MLNVVFLMGYMCSSTAGIFNVFLPVFLLAQCLPVLQIHEPSEGWKALSLPSHVHTGDPSSEEELLPQGLQAICSKCMIFSKHVCN